MKPYVTVVVRITSAVSRMPLAESSGEVERNLSQSTANESTECTAHPVCSIARESILIANLGSRSLPTTVLVRPIGERIIECNTQYANYLVQHSRKVRPALGSSVYSWKQELGGRVP